MNENQINVVLYSNLGVHSTFYKGTFANDELNTKKINIPHLNTNKCFSFIVNSLTREENEKIGHWVAVYIRIEKNLKKIYIKFIDSYKQNYRVYGGGINNYIDRLRVLAFKNKFTFIFEETPFRTQASGSKTCGIYTIFGIISLRKCSSITLNRIFSKFTSYNRQKNDSIMVEYIIDVWPRRFCSDILSSTNKKYVSFCPKKIFNSSKCLMICRCNSGNICCNTSRSSQYIRMKVSNLFI